MSVSDVNSPPFSPTGEINHNYIYKYKVLLIGDINVGKTSIFNRLKLDTFNDQRIPTVGAEYFTKDIKLRDKNVQVFCYNFSYNIQIQVWDTVGDEKNNAIPPSYYRDVDAVIFVYDMSSYETRLHLREWLNESIKHITNPFIKVAFGNKNDLETVSYWDVEFDNEYFQQKCDVMFNYPLSAKTGRNVDKVIILYFYLYNICFFLKKIEV